MTCSIWTLSTFVDNFQKSFYKERENIFLATVHSKSTKRHWSQTDVLSKFRRDQYRLCFNCRFSIVRDLFNSLTLEPPKTPGKTQQTDSEFLFCSFNAVKTRFLSVAHHYFWQFKHADPSKEDNQGKSVVEEARPGSRCSRYVLVVPIVSSPCFKNFTTERIKNTFILPITQLM